MLRQSKSQTKKLLTSLLSIGVLVSAAIVSLAISNTANAAELHDLKFNWDSKSRSTLSYGSTSTSYGQASPGSMSVGTDSVTGKSGEMTLKGYALVKTFWLFVETGEQLVQCRVAANYTFISESYIKLTPGTIRAETNDPNNPPPPFCTQLLDLKADYATGMAATKTYAIGGTRATAETSTETDAQKQVQFVVWTNDKSQDLVPAKLSLSITGASTSGVQVNRGSYKFNDTVNYFGYNFSSGVGGSNGKALTIVTLPSPQSMTQLAPGNYTVCPTTTPVKDYVSCKSFTKEKFKSLYVELGTRKEPEEFSSARRIQTKITLDIPVADVCAERSYGPLQLVLKDSEGTVLKVEDSEVVTSTRMDGCDDVTSLPSGSSKMYFNNSYLTDIDPGTYTVCIGENHCETVTKEKDRQAVVEFEITGQEAIDLQNPGGTTEPSCGTVVNGLGWALCPVLEALGGMADGMWNFASAILNVSPIKQTGSTGGASPEYQVWGIFRNIANVALVIVFLLTIFSQISSIGLSNYGVKKMIPNLIVAAIAINASFYIVQIVVDLFNIIGASLYGVINNIADSALKASLNELNWAQFLTQGIFTAVGLGAVGVAAFAAPAALFWFVLPILLAAVLGFLAAVITLLFRQAVVPLLAIIAPIAIILYLLPNTKKWFDKWLGLFITMLALYPLAALLFAGLKLTAAIINSSGQWYSTLFALIVISAPLFMLPFLAKQTGPVLGKLNDGLRGLGQKIQSPLNKYSAERRQEGMSGALSKPGGGIGRRAMRAFDNSRRRRSLQQDVDKSATDAAWAGKTVTDPKLAGLKLQQAQNQTMINAANSPHQAALTGAMASNGATIAAGALGAAAAGNEHVADAIAEAVSEALEKQIKAAEIKAKAEIAPGDIDEMGRRFEEASKSGDSIRAQAMQGMLLNSGAKGINEWRARVDGGKVWNGEVGQNGERIKSKSSGLEASGGMAGSIAEDLRKRVLSNHPGMKGTDAAIDNWATSRRAFSDVRKDKKLWDGVTNTEFSGQKVSAQMDSIASGAINKTRADEIQANSQIFDAMDETVKAEIRRIAGTGDQNVNIPHGS